ncbi:hypothetical protein LINPERHAP2_LOCUS14136, partial [Linum perenne]
MAWQLSLTMCGYHKPRTLGAMWIPQVIITRTGGDGISIQGEGDLRAFVIILFKVEGSLCESIAISTYAGRGHLRSPLVDEHSGIQLP